MFCLHRIRVAIAIALTSAGLLLFTGWSKPAAAETIDAKLKEVINPPAGNKVTIAPMTKSGTLDAGNPTTVDGDKIFTGIFERIGIKACTTEPKDLKGKPGFLRFEPNSGVLNKGGKRSTFGYFITVVESLEEKEKPKPSDDMVTKAEKTVTKEYFALFSYDKIDTPKVLCATEFFLFGPYTRNGTKPDPNPPKLVLGLAVAADGTLLTEVPIELAAVINHLKDHDAKETVKPGVDPGKGCMECHSGDQSDEPQQTIPFPWAAIP
jgi:hypothetical protein